MTQDTVQQNLNHTTMMSSVNNQQASASTNNLPPVSDETIKRYKEIHTAWKQTRQVQHPTKKRIRKKRALDQAQIIESSSPLDDHEALLVQ